MASLLLCLYLYLCMNVLVLERGARSGSLAVRGGAQGAAWRGGIQLQLVALQLPALGPGFRRRRLRPAEKVQPQQRSRKFMRGSDKALMVLLELYGGGRGRGSGRQLHRVQHQVLELLQSFLRRAQSSLQPLLAQHVLLRRLLASPEGRIQRLQSSQQRLHLLARARWLFGHNGHRNRELR